MISVLRFLGSLRVGVALLLAIFGLVFWGTLFEARAGVELGTERFFENFSDFSFCQFTLRFAFSDSADEEKCGNLDFAFFASHSHRGKFFESCVAGKF